MTTTRQQRGGKREKEETKKKETITQDKEASRQGDHDKDTRDNTEDNKRRRQKKQKGTITQMRQKYTFDEDRRRTHEKEATHPRYEVHDDALPVGGKYDTLYREELLDRLEWRQQRPRRLVEHQKTVQGYAVARVVHH